MKDEFADLKLKIHVSEEDLKHIEVKPEKVEKKVTTMRERLFPDLYSMPKKDEQITGIKPSGIPFTDSSRDSARAERKKRR